ncbi:molybdopterin-guanine dinucleotide biosynthesis protein A [Galbibacter orientalis DSM 19592]|uniref:Molybdopterin-guanine dinucleotide biosynthesis protein A n=1 Tax=Galbibacter orientalis DSM 19592 TaxID=926559 RepID=I3C202_9FLAO|nr:molybdopterin-guanine dinucleotide biosynthesis protein A [Galbibacter orientalis DSM 19592]
MRKNREEKVTSTGKLYGLVLAGGLSTRMKTDKGLIAYHGVPQRTYLYKLLKEVCDEAYISIRKEQENEFTSEEKLIIDEDVYKGPFNGILSAHHFDKNSAWLIIACDLPLINKRAIKQLIVERDVNSIATVFTTSTKEMPEPLCAIWEAEGLKQAEVFIAAQKSFAPIKFLRNSNVKIVKPLQDDVLLNVNEEKQRIEVVKKLKNK